MEIQEIFLPYSYRGNRSKNVFILEVNESFIGYDRKAWLTTFTRIDPRIKLASVDRLSEDFRSISRHIRLATWFSMVTGVGFLVIAVIGIFGVVSYLMRMRHYTFGVHLAMGATYKSLIKDQAKLLLPPIGISLALVASLSYFMIGYLRSVMALEFSIYWSAFTLSIVVVLFVSTMAFLIPVWRTLRNDPIRALRDD